MIGRASSCVLLLLFVIPPDPMVRESPAEAPMLNDPAPAANARLFTPSPPGMSRVLVSCVVPAITRAVPVGLVSVGGTVPVELVQFPAAFQLGPIEPFQVYV